MSADMELLKAKLFSVPLQAKKIGWWKRRKPLFFMLF
jgi:hypothetical protein